jgi:hypothetical protein
MLPTVTRRSTEQQFNAAMTSPVTPAEGRLAVAGVPGDKGRGLLARIHVRGIIFERRGYSNSLAGVHRWAPGELSGAGWIRVFLWRENADALSSGSNPQRANRFRENRPMRESLETVSEFAFAISVNRKMVSVRTSALFLPGVGFGSELLGSGDGRLDRGTRPALRHVNAHHARPQLRLAVGTGTEHGSVATRVGATESSESTASVRRFHFQGPPKDQRKDAGATTSPQMRPTSGSQRASR